ncbi:MAG: hypothetical protein LW863_13795 [Flammeovirgaceae bacterium]|nr:hypothetical protein [Flammeovirgaceae bacterium]
MNATVRQSQFEPSHALFDAHHDFFSFRQLQLNLTDYFQGFKDRLDHLERLNGPMGQDKARMDEYLATHHPDEEVTEELMMAAKESCREAFLATILLFQADKRRYGELQRIIKNNYTIDRRAYPKTLVDAFNVLTKFEREHRRDTQSGSTLLNVEDGEQNGRRRNKKGKRQDQNDDSSPSDRNSGKAIASSETYTASKLESIDMTLHQTSPVRIPKSWIVIDTASTADMFMPHMLTNIYRSQDTLEVVSTAGKTQLHEKGTLPGYPVEVWCNRSSVANILSFHNLQKFFHVEYDNDYHDLFRVYLGDNHVLEFKPYYNGLYYTDTGAQGTDTFVLLNTVQDNMTRHTPRGIKQAQLARRVHGIIMRPNTRKFTELITMGQIRNCPVEVRQIQAAEDIYGPNIGSLKGKTPRHTPTSVHTGVDPVPTEIQQQYQHVTLAMDIMFLNKLPFLVTMARDLQIGTVTELSNRQVPTVKHHLTNVIRTYERRGFVIATITADDEFQALAAAMPAYLFNLCGADDHVPEIERYIRTIKDSVRSQYNDLPFAYIPRTVLIYMVRNAVFWRNAFPADAGVSTVYSPRYIIEGRNIDYDKHVRIPFGAYAQTHEEHNNNMDPRTVGAICLGPTGNAQGSHYFFSLSTGRILTRTRFTELPMPADVIDRVSNIGRQQGMPKSLTFADRFGHEFTDLPHEIDDAHDSDYETSDDYADSDDDDDDDVLPGDDLDDDCAGVDVQQFGDDERDADAASITGVDAATPENFPHVYDVYDDASVDESTDANAEGNTGVYAETTEVYPEAEEITETTEVYTQETTEVYTGETSEMYTGGTTGVNTMNSNDAINDVNTTDGNNEPEPPIPVNTHTMKLRARKPLSNPTHLLGRGYEDAFSFLTSQMSAKKGLKHFGKAGTEAIVAEMAQIHYRRVIKPRMASSLTREQKRDALRYLMFLKQKKSGRIKARGCADGRKQRLWKNKEDTSAPTVRTESVFLSAAIDAMEGRVVVTVDVPGAFMQADIDEFIVVKFEGELAQLLEKVDPASYSKYKVMENGKEVIYAELQKALYGTLQAALLFWKEMRQFLVDVLGFTINPYDECVANKTVDGKQCTILWHVDDLKISHVSAAVIEDILAKMSERFGKEDPLTINRGTIHDYLGMTLDYSTAGKVKISMVDYIERMLGDLPEGMDGTATTPAANHLFDVNNAATKLDHDTSDFFHTNVAKLLFLCKRARPDIHTAVAFLTTRVTSPDVDDYAKLRRVMRYLRGTINLPLTLESHPSGNMRWWVDASFAVHPDMKSQTGAVMSLGRWCNDVNVLSTKDQY